MSREVHEAANALQDPVLSLLHDYTIALPTWMAALLAFAFAVAPATAMARSDRSLA